MLKYVIGVVILLSAVITGILFLTHGHTFAVLNPQGLIATKEHYLLLVGVGISAVVVIPLFGLTFWIAWKYRAGNDRANYQPDWDSDVKRSGAWWLVLATAISILAVVAWQSTHDLDPHKPLVAGSRSMTIQVVALQWKWLFIYPEQDIATVNYIAIPADVPVTFELTADAPMNSFWIPQLGGQMYAMSGMITRLHLMADQPGEYAGSAAEISGAGFADMKFKVRSTTDQDFEAWVQTIKASPNYLALGEYQSLARPERRVSTATYSSVEQGLYDTIIMQFMAPMTHSSVETTPMDNMPGMAM